jgi:hypothetical protein
VVDLGEQLFELVTLLVGVGLGRPSEVSASKIVSQISPMRSEARGA